MGFSETAVAGDDDPRSSIEREMLGLIRSMYEANRNILRRVQRLESRNRQLEQAILPSALVIQHPNRRFGGERP